LIFQEPNHLAGDYCATEDSSFLSAQLTLALLASVQPAFAAFLEEQHDLAGVPVSFALTLLASAAGAADVVEVALGSDLVSLDWALAVKAMPVIKANTNRIFFILEMFMQV
jgi:hypothetical protein